jgi:hypothetical protein
LRGYKVVLFKVTNGKLFLHEVGEQPVEITHADSPIQEGLIRIESFLNDMLAKGYKLVTIGISPEKSMTTYFFIGED